MTLNTILSTLMAITSALTGVMLITNDDYAAAGVWLLLAQVFYLTANPFILIYEMKE